MKEFSNPTKLLQDSQVRSYFMGILASKFSDQLKYQRFIDFFENENIIRQEVLKAYWSQSEESIEKSVAETIERVAREVGEKLEIWVPHTILGETRESIERAIQWLKRTQNKDGGWGYKPLSESVFWETAYSAMCIAGANKMRECFSCQSDIGEMLGKSIEWLNGHLTGWTYDYGPDQRIPVYNVSLVIMVYYKLGTELFGEFFRENISKAVVKLVASKCHDGGWAARIWDQQEKNLIEGCESEVGATSFALRALSEVLNLEHTSVITEAIQCLIRDQNQDGSWNDIFQNNSPSISKTCDAAQALFAGKEFDVCVPGLEESIEKAIIWLQGQERAIFYNGFIKGWGWDGIPREIEFGAFNNDILCNAPRRTDKVFLKKVYKKDDKKGKFLLKESISNEEKDKVMRILINTGYDYDYYISTCLTLETLVKMSGPSLPLLTSNVQWLIENQYKKEDSKEDGKWGRNTARITLSLVAFYRKLSEGSLEFQRSIEKNNDT